MYFSKDLDLYHNFILSQVLTKPAFNTHTSVTQRPEKSLTSQNKAFILLEDG